MGFERTADGAGEPKAWQISRTVSDDALLAITRFGVGMIRVLAVSAATGLVLGSVGLV